MDVHHLYILLAPGVADSSDVESNSHKKRLLVVEHNRMPVITDGPGPVARAVSWCHVDTVSHHVKKIAQVLNAETIGVMGDDKRHTVEPARAVAQGFYTIADIGGHAVLAYVLDEPKSLGEVQEAFHIDKEASYIVTVHNPLKSKRVENTRFFPPYLQERFESAARDWVPLSSTDFLDHEGVELCLAGAAKNVELDLGSLGIDLKMMESSGARPLLKEALVRDLEMSMKSKLVVPLKTGEWA